MSDSEDAQTAATVDKKKKKRKKSKKKKLEQTSPPRLGLSSLFPDGVYPEGELQEYKDDNTYRTTNEEARYKERLALEDPETTYQNTRRAAEVHRQVRQYAREHIIKPGRMLIEIAEEIEGCVRAVVEANGLESGIAFPTGLNINSCAAHWSPNPGDRTVLKSSDVLKVDFGVHVKGRICDSAFTVAFEPTYDKLLEATKAATETGVREAGIDVRLGELAGCIQETMESYEVEVGGTVLPVRPIENFSGHSMAPFHLHSGKSLMLIKNSDQTKMEEGDVWAIETFGTTGRGYAIEAGECSHFAKIFNAPHVPLRLTSAQSLLKTINKNFATLPFCRRYLDRIGETQYLLGLKSLVAEGVVREYLPLWDERGSMTAQFEHTVLLRPTVKEVVSRGDDY